MGWDRSRLGCCHTRPFRLEQAFIRLHCCEIKPCGSWRLRRPISAGHRCSPGVTSASARAQASAARSLYSAHAGLAARNARCPAHRRGTGTCTAAAPPSRACLPSISYHSYPDFLSATLCVPTTRLVRGNNNYIAILLQTRPDHTFSSSLLFFSFSFPTLPCRALASSSATPPRPSPIPYIINSASQNLRSRDLVAGARRLLRKGKKKSTHVWERQNTASIIALHAGDPPNSHLASLALFCLSASPAESLAKDGRSASSAATTDRAHLSTKLDVNLCICQCAATARHCLPCSK